MIHDLKKFVTNVLLNAVLRLFRSVSRAKGFLERRHPEDSKRPRILLLRLDVLGDFVLTLPLIEMIKSSVPDLELSVAVRAPLAALLEQNTMIDKVYKVENCGTARFGRLKFIFSCVLMWFTDLRKVSFDKVVVVRFDGNIDKELLLSGLITTNRRVFSNQTFCSFAQCQADQTNQSVALSAAPHEHELQRNLRFHTFATGLPWTDEGLLRRAALANWLLPTDMEKAAGLAKEFRGNAAVLIAVGFGAGHPMRVWPVASFVEMMQLLQQRCDASFIFFGGIEDQAAARLILESCRLKIKDLTGRTTVRESLALLSYCDGFIGNDSGAMHLAALADKPVVELSSFAMSLPSNHPNDPTRFGPVCTHRHILRPKHAIAPCKSFCEADYAHCITQITPNVAASALFTLLEKSGALKT